MPEVKNNGNLEEALKRFKRQCARNQKGASFILALL